VRSGALRWLAGAARGLRQLGRAKCVVLLYHRVADAQFDPQLLCVTPEHLRQHLEVVRRRAFPLSLRELASTLGGGRVPSGGVVLTFDDGYADNLHHAKPPLERCDVPATVFVTTGSVGSGQEFWWDELERLLLQPGSLPRELTLEVGGDVRHWELGEAAESPPSARHDGHSWSIQERRDPTARHRVYRDLCHALRPLADAARRSALEQLRSWAGASPAARATHRGLTPDELVELAKGGIVEIGSHTVSHPVLASLSQAEQEAEIGQSKAYLERLLGREVAAFSYPFGTTMDYTAATIAAVRGAGHRCACANLPGAVRRGADRFQLPRVLVRDWDGDEFERRMRDWFRVGGM